MTDAAFQPVDPGPLPGDAEAGTFVGGAPYTAAGGKLTTQEPRTPLRVTVTPGDRQGDPYAGFTEYQPPGGAAGGGESAPGQARQGGPAAPGPGVPGAAGGDPYAGFAEFKPATVEAPARRYSAGESGLYGALSGLTFDAFPAIGGLIAAGRSPEDQAKAVKAMEAGSPGDEDYPSAAGELAALVKGLGKIGYEHLIAPALGINPGGVSGLVTGEKAGPGTVAYRKERDRMRGELTSAQEQNPKSYLTGELGAAIATPVGGSLKAATTAGRIAKGARAGATQGGLYGAGGAVSEGKDIGDVLIDAGKGAAVGAGLGTAGAGAMEIGRGVVNKGREVWRGVRDVDAEAARKILGGLETDWEKGPALDVAARDAARRAGTPTAIIDAGRGVTRDLARSSGNRSGEAWETLNDYTSKRFGGQGERIAKYIERIFGGRLNAPDEASLLEDAYLKQARPKYAKAYRDGDRPIISAELERLMGAPEIEEAMKKAIPHGKTRAIVEGFGGFRSPATVTKDGRLVWHKGSSGVPTYPNIQFWDYTQRMLSDMVEKAKLRGQKEEFAAISQLHLQLNKELDRLVPSFKKARLGAAKYFAAKDATEAGKNFVMMNKDPNEARAAFREMTPAEKEMFARGFANELVLRILGAGDRANVLDKVFINSGLARQKIQLAIGPQRARELEALLRAETVVDEARKALGNSTTARQLKQLGMAGGHAAGGGGAVAAYESLKEGDFNPKHILLGALTVGAARHGAHVVDERVARRIAEMLVSNDPALLAKGVKIAAGNPRIFDALRYATQAVARLGEHEIGPDNVIGSAAAALEHVAGGGEGTEHHDPNHPDNQQQP